MSLLLKHVSRSYNRASRSRHPVFRRFVASQASQAEKVEVEKKDEKLELDFTKFNLAARVVQKQPALPPLIKNMYLGEIDERYFPFLEVVEKEHVDTYFKNRRTVAQEFLSRTEDPEQCISNLKSLNNLGYNVPQVYNGSGYDITETTLNSEIEAHSLNANAILNAHRMVIQAITEHGTEEQKSRYLPKLGNGEIIGTIAIYESEVAEERPFNTIATPGKDGFELNGEKTFVINGEKANLFLVLASSIRQDHAKKETHGVSAFLIDENEPGVLKGPPIKTLGCEEVDKCTISFTKVPVRENRVLGTLNDVNKLAMEMIQLSRLQAAITANQLLKRVLNHFGKYCTETKILGGYPKDLELSQVRLGQMTTQIYALESMIYFTTQLADAYDNQDIDLEVAATKLFAMQTLMDVSTTPFQTIGSQATLQDAETAKNLRDAFQIVSQGDSMDMISIYLGLQAIQYSGNDDELAKFVTEKRNPMKYPQNIWKNLFDSPYKKIKITKHFDYSLHPSLKPSAEMLEVAMKRVQIATETALSRRGMEITLAHSEMERLAKCGTLLYAMLATMSRASRSYCIGVRYADVETVLANTFSMECMNEINSMTEKIYDGENMSNDENHKTIATQFFAAKGYFCEHPLLRVF